jgi:hypothetical protein
MSSNMVHFLLRNTHFTEKKTMQQTLRRAQGRIRQLGNTVEVLKSKLSNSGPKVYEFGKGFTFSLRLLCYDLLHHNVALAACPRVIQVQYRQFLTM